jgi:nicotinic acid mononucleotide adenylyltransferase
MEYINTKVSSIELRNRMEKNLILIEGLLPRAVLDFIKRNNIYKKN